MMDDSTLLEQIQMEAIDSSHDLTDLLRKCRVLAQRLGNEDLKEWVRFELMGYPDDYTEALPDYRILRNVLVHGSYIGALGAQLSSVSIPQSSVKNEEVRRKIFTIYVPYPVSGIYHFVNSSEDHALEFQLPPEVLGFIKNPRLEPMYQFQLSSAWRLIDPSTFEGLLDIVRTKILDFTLELTSESERTGTPIRSLKEKEPEIVQHIYNTNIHGPVGNIAQGNRDVSQSATVTTGDLASLKDALQELRLPDELEAEILDVAGKEQPEGGKLPARLADLVGKVAALGTKGVLAVSGTVAVDLITNALQQFLGI